MKALMTTILLMTISTMVFAQEFAPIGATWYIHVAEPFAPSWSGTLTNESIRDTTIKGLNCKVLFKSQATIFNEISGEYILCHTGQTILHYIPTLDSLNVVMDFGAEVGESWISFDQANNYESFGFERNYKYQVDSLGYLFTENNDTLRIQYITQFSKLWSEPDSLYRFPEKRELIQSLGFRSALLPTNGGDGFTDDQLETDIRCYEDSNLGLVKLIGEENCITSKTNELSQHLISIYPNPSTGLIYLKGIDDIQIEQINVIDSKGKINISENSQSLIDLSQLKNGVYFIQFISQKHILTKRIILKK